jgi:hypothetical protein
VIHFLDEFWFGLIAKDPQTNFEKERPMKKLVANLLGIVVLLVVCTQVAHATSADHVFSVGANQHVYDTYHTAGSTTLTTVDATAGASGAPLAATGSTLAGYFIDSEEFLYFVTTGAHLGLLYLYNGSWHYEDLTALTGAPALPCYTLSPCVGSETTLMGFSDNSKPFIFYSDGTQIIEIWGSSGTWYWDNLSASTQAPFAAVGLYQQPTPLTGFTIDSEALLYYVDTTGNVQELYDDGNGWVNVNITSQAAAPPASVSAPFGLTALAGFSDGLQAHVFYVTSNGHVHRLYSASGSPWSNTDLTTNASAPAAAFPWALGGFVYNSRYWVFYDQATSEDVYAIQGIYAPVNTDTWTTETVVAAGTSISTPYVTDYLLTAYADTSSNTAHIFFVAFYLSTDFIEEAVTSAGSNTWGTDLYFDQPAVRGYALGGTFH